MRRTACALLLLAALGLSARAAPLKNPVARPGACFDSMVADIKKADQPGKGYGVIFYGDSITETLKGTDKCRDCTGAALSERRSSCAGGPQALAKHFGKYKPGVMGMSMDESAHLLYRLQNGHIPTVNKPRVAVILIGANDMTNSGWSMTDQKKKEQALAKEVPGMVGRIVKAVQVLRTRMPQTQVLVMGVLPRGTGTGKGLKNADNDFRWPSHYGKAVAEVNAQLKAYAAKTKGVEFLDCGAVFVQGGLRGGYATLAAKLMADAIHPTGAGWDKLGACMAPTIARLYGATTAGALVRRPQA